jgi:hypothetical protein
MSEDLNEAHDTPSAPAPAAASNQVTQPPATNSPEVIQDLPVANHEPELLQELLPSVNYYKILNVPKDAHYDHIEEQYVLLVQEKHPDKIALSRAVTRSDLVNYFNIEDAYATLTNKDRRVIHDNDLTKIDSYAAVMEHLQSNTNSANQPSAGETLINSIIAAACKADRNLLLKLLPEYKAMHQTRREKKLNTKIFNWLLRNAAYSKANDVAMTLIDFGADINHYGDIKVFGLKDGATSIANYQLPVVRKDKRDMDIPGLRLEGNEDSSYTLEQRNLATKEAKEARKHFYIDLARARVLLSMFCYWLHTHKFEYGLLENNLGFRLYTEPTLAWVGHTRDMFRGSDYTTRYILQQFQNAKNPGALTILSYRMRYLIDCIMMMLSLDSSEYIDNKLGKVGMLLHTHQPNTRLMFRAIEWQNNIMLAYMLSWFTALVGCITGAAANNNKDALSAGYIMFAQACIIWFGIPLALAIIKPFTCGAYDVNPDFSNSMWSAYTNALLVDVVKQEHSSIASKPVVQNTTPVQPMLTQFRGQAPANEVTVEIAEERFHTANDVTRSTFPSASMV